MNERHASLIIEHPASTIPPESPGDCEKMAETKRDVFELIFEGMREKRREAE